VRTVVDTSVVLKWFVAEDDSEQAASVVGRSLVAPDILLAELGNALWKKRNRGEIGAAQAQAALARAPDLLGLLPSASLANDALAIALELEHPVYDCFYLALAERIGGVVLTADLRLLRRVVATGYAARAIPLEDLE
jgi:predicted nucleic acid-binding protein